MKLINLINEQNEFKTIHDVKRFLKNTMGLKSVPRSSGKFGIPLANDTGKDLIFN